MARKNEKELSRRVRKAKYHVYSNDSDRSRFLAVKFDLDKGIIVTPFRQKFYDECKEKYGWD